MNVLHLIANPKPSETSVSKKLALEFFSTLMEKDPDVVVENVDLYQNKPPFVSADALNYFWRPGSSTPSQSYPARAKKP